MRISVVNGLAYIGRENLSILYNQGIGLVPERPGGITPLLTTFTPEKYLRQKSQLAATTSVELS